MTGLAPITTYVPRSLDHASWRVVQDAAARRGDVTALVRSVSGTIRKLVQRYGRGLDDSARADLRAAGEMGAFLAAQSYSIDDERGASFNSYAFRRILTHIFREIFFFWSKGRFGITKSTSKLFYQYRKTERLLAERGITPTPDAIADYLGLPPDTVRAVTSTVSSPDAVAHRAGSDDAPAQERAIDPSASVLEVLCQGADAAAVHRALGGLKPRERHVIHARFFEGKVLREVASELGIVTERARQIEAKALKKMGASLRRAGIER